MPWCPKCKNEYREGILQCAECKVPLVESLEEVGGSDEPEGYEEKERELLTEEENLEELSQLIAKGATPEKLQENDLAFHHLLGSCTTNPLLEQIYNIVIDFMEPSITATHKRQHGEYVYKVHHDMVDVIKTRNGERISEAVAASVDTWSSLQDL